MGIYMKVIEQMTKQMVKAIISIQMEHYMLGKYNSIYSNDFQ